MLHLCVLLTLVNWASHVELVGENCELNLEFGLKHLVNVALVKRVEDAPFNVDESSVS